MPLSTTSIYRYAYLPYHIQYLIQCRLASTTSRTDNSLYPYPTSPHPTPHEIFHLQPGALQKDIKSRYYELVRIHHPDSPHSREIPQDISHARFRAITMAYDVLNGRGRLTSPSGESSSFRSQYPQHYSEFSRPHYSKRHDPSAEYVHGRWKASDFDTIEDKKKDAVIIIAGIAALLFGFAPLFYISPLHVADARHRAASRHLAEVRRDARMHGHERREAIRDRVRNTRQESENSKEVAQERGVE